MIKYMISRFAPNSAIHYPNPSNIGFIHFMKINKKVQLYFQFDTAKSNHTLYEPMTKEKPKWADGIVAPKFKNYSLKSNKLILSWEI